MSVTIKDIASQAGVSHQTVSKIINNRPSFVGKVTREKVLSLVRELNYLPNYFAKKLRKEKKNTIGVMGGVFGFRMRHYIYRSTSEGIEEGIDSMQGRYGVNFLGGSMRHNFERSMEMVKDGIVDGLVLIILGRNLLRFQNKILTDLERTNIPFVAVHSTSKNLPFHNVGANSYKSGYDAANHFINKGCENVKIYRWWDEEFIHSQEALAGFVTALKEHGAENIIIDNRENGNQDRIISAYKYFKHMKSLPDAVYFRPDGVAYGALKALKERGVRVPEDMAVMGCDDEQPADYFWSDLTCMHHPFLEKGATAVNMLVDIIEGKRDRNEVQQEILDYHLVERNTTNKISK